MSKFILTLAILTIIGAISGLNAQETVYQMYRSNGITEMTRKNYREAKELFEQAKTSPDLPSNNDLDTLIKQCNEKLDSIRITMAVISRRDEEERRKKDSINIVREFNTMIKIEDLIIASKDKNSAAGCDTLYIDNGKVDNIMVVVNYNVNTERNLDAKIVCTNNNTHVSVIPNDSTIVFDKSKKTAVKDWNQLNIESGSYALKIYYKNHIVYTKQIALVKGGKRESPSWLANLEKEKVEMVRDMAMMGYEPACGSLAKYYLKIGDLEAHCRAYHWSQKSSVIDREYVVGMLKSYGFLDNDGTPKVTCDNIMY